MHFCVCFFSFLFFSLRDLVGAVMGLLDASGPDFRIKGKFERRVYYTMGTLYAIHLDNNDKLKVRRGRECALWECLIWALELANLYVCGA